MNETNKNILKNWSEKLGQPIAQLEAKVQDMIAENKKTFPGHPEEWYETKAIGFVGNLLSGALRSNAVPVLGVNFAVSGKYDIAQKALNSKKELFETDRASATALNGDGVPEVAGDNYVVKAKDGKETKIPEGTPIDTRKWFVEPNEEGKGGKANPNYGHALKPFYQKTVLGFGRTQKDKGIKLLTINLRGKEVDLAPSRNEAYLTRANVKTNDATQVICTSSAGMQFVPSPYPEMEGQDMVALLRSAPAKYRANVLAVKDWHEANKDNPGRFVIVEGDVVYKKEDPMSNGNYLFSLGDPLVDPAFRGQTVFAPGEMKAEIEKFGRGSKVIVIGRTDLGKDLESGEKTQVNINLMGIYITELVTPEEAEILFPSEAATVDEA